MTFITPSGILVCTGFLCLLAASLGAAAFAAVAEADVCVYGGTSGGVTAAVAAARAGKKVILIEPGRRLGGMTSGGLGHTDIGAVDTIGGLSREFYQRIFRYYQKPDAWTSQKREAFLNWMPKMWGIDGPTMEKVQFQFLFEPRAAEQVFNDMVREAGVEVILSERLDLKNGVHRDGVRITNIIMESGREFAAKVFIDASYEGDLMACAGVKYIVGREPNSVYDETLNGSFPFTPMPFPKISPFRIDGDPSSGLLPRVDPKPPLPKGSGDHRVQAYNFRLCLTNVPENRVPIEKPADYDPLEYELLARRIALMKDLKPGPRPGRFVTLAGSDGAVGVSFNPVPNRKTDCNADGEFGTDMYGANYNYPEGDYAERQKIWERHKSYHLGMLWFLGNDPRVPEKVRAEMQKWGLPRDEFKDTGHFPHQIYVREARRMISDYVVTEHDAMGRRAVEDPVAQASYALDSHGVTLYIDETNLLHRERGFYVKGIKPFPISYKALRPKASECENLLVPWSVSASHAAYGSVRMEPVFMMLGHAAGAAASIAIDDRCGVQAVKYATLRERLSKEGLNPGPAARQQGKP
jgi:hypothetical protein